LSEELSVTVADYRERAARLLPTELFERSFGTPRTGSGATDTNNEQGFGAFALRPRVLTAAGSPDLSTEVLGQPISLPVFLAPVGAQRRYSPEGEAASARAAGAMGTIMCVGTGSSVTIEAMNDVAPGPFWFQLFVFKDRSLTESLVRRAEEAGYKAIVVTVDTPGTRSTERDGVNLHLRLPRVPVGLAAYETPFANLAGTGIETTEHVIEAFESDLRWADLEWLCATTSLPVVVKGIQTAEDALLCSAHGADGLVVSNHGGHALAGARATIETLPEIVDAVDGRLEVYLDGGIRKGTDVLKAVALGAKAVSIGRAMIWGLAAGGEEGVREVLEVLREELLVAAHCCGVGDIRTIDRSLVTRLASSGTDPLHQVDALERLSALFDRGLLSQDEFDGLKTRLLGARDGHR
jgi:4-hydroxymandelate oxidase